MSELKVTALILMLIERGNAKHSSCLRSEEKATGAEEHIPCQIVTKNKEKPIDLRERSIDLKRFF